ncbi:MAG: Ig-like domain-containing protein, partial [Trichodesmium sp. St2_bin2_1]|nr:Ig-like domain-containing protein [Trichodesmium sp. St2_bin2_1]
GEDTGTVTGTVTPVNDPPVADDETFTMDEDGAPVTLDLLDGDTDPDNDDILSIKSIKDTALTPGTAQTITVPNGTVNVAANGDITFTPDSNYNGPISFDYVVQDGNGGEDTGTVTGTTGTVTPVNDPPNDSLVLDTSRITVNKIPTPTNDSTITNKGEPVTFNIIDNDTDTDGTLDLTTVDLNPSTPGTQETTKTVPGEGTYTVDNAGNLTFTPEDDFLGTATPITYTVKDNKGGVSNLGEISVTVNLDIEALQIDDDRSCPPPPTTELVDLPVILPVVLSVDFEELLVATAETDFLQISDGIRASQVAFDALEGNDMVNGSNNSDIIFGGDGQDRIMGNLNNDYLNGKEKNDNINAGKGDDIAHGGKGDDTILGDIGSDSIIGDRGNDSLIGSTVGNNDNIIGRDLINGGPGNDSIYGNHDDDTVIGGKDNDQVYGGKGDDIISGQKGSDTVSGDNGDDKIVEKEEGADFLYGGRGNDIIEGSRGDDLINGGKEDDFVHGGKDNDSILGDLGNDTILGENGDDTILGGNNTTIVGDVSGEDYIDGGIGDDSLGGNYANDTIIGGEGVDTVRGGKDDDWIY